MAFDSKLKILDELRLQIDEIDKALVPLLERRASVVFSIGKFKNENKIPSHDPIREKSISKKIKNMTSQAGSLTSEEMSSLFMSMVEQFRLLESAHMRINQATNMMASSKKVAIFGFGLMGSSLYLGLTKKLPRWSFQVFDPNINPKSFAKWKADQNLSNIELVNIDKVSHGDIYILAAPVSVNVKNLLEYDFPKKSLVLDLGSTKKNMDQAFTNRFAQAVTDFTYIGGHPLAGKEVSGFENGDPLLFYNKTFCWVVPTIKKVDSTIIDTLDALTHCLGATPIWITADEHDKALAWTSHLPQLLSSTLATCLTDKSFSHLTGLFPRVIRDFLRVSGSTFKMWQPIVDSNQNQLHEALHEVIQRLMQLQNDLRRPNGCEKLFDQSNEFYEKFKKGA